MKIMNFSPHILLNNGLKVNNISFKHNSGFKIDGSDEDNILTGIYKLIGYKNFTDEEKKLLSSFKEKLKEAVIKSPEKKSILPSVLSNLECDEMVSIGTILAFFDEILNLENHITLKKALDSGVKFRLVISNGPAQYMQIPKNEEADKMIVLCQKYNGKNNTASLAHELAHAFDYNTPIESVSYLSPNYNYIVQMIDGAPEIVGIKPNSTSFILDSEDEHGKLYKRADAFQNNMSLSKEFHKAYLRDCRNLLEIDKKYGLKQGTTFKRLVSDFDEKSLFGYYLGGTKDSPKIDIPFMHKEMFAQLTALYTSGKTTRPEFDKKVLEYFPNMYEFIRDFFESINSSELF